MTLLEQLLLFKGLDRPVLEEIHRQAIFREVQTGEFYFLQGDPAAEAFVLLEGKVRLGSINEDGQQVVIRLIGQGTLFGLIALTEEGIYPVSAEAMETCRAMVWQRENLLKVMAGSPKLALNAIRMMADQVREVQDRFRELSTERVERRLARSLIRLASQTGRKTPEGVLIDLPLSRQDLAEMSGTSLYTASRILSQWEGQGLVIAGREKVIIRHPHGLVTIAEDLVRPDKQDPSLLKRKDMNAGGK